MKTKNIKEKKKRFGVSIAEITVVLALISIVSLSIVSFTTMLSAHSSSIATKLKVEEDIEACNTVIKNWVDIILRDYSADITITDNTLCANIDSNNYKIILEDNTLTAEFPDRQNLTLEISKLTSLHFEKFETEKDELYLCTATYKLPRISQEEVTKEIKFFINSHIGDVFSDSAEVADWKFLNTSNIKKQVKEFH